MKKAGNILSFLEIWRGLLMYYRYSTGTEELVVAPDLERKKQNRQRKYLGD